MYARMYDLCTMYFAEVLSFLGELVEGTSVLCVKGEVDKEWWNNIVLRQENVEQVDIYIYIYV